jgi:hypothetical protein
MDRYHALIRGENFCIAMNGKPQKVGFYTNRWVEANDPEEAAALVVSLLRAEPELRGLVLNAPDDPPLLYVDELEPVADLEAPSGFVFFGEEGVA